MKEESTLFFQPITALPSWNILYSRYISSCWLEEQYLHEGTAT